MDANPNFAISFCFEPVQDKKHMITQTTTGRISVVLRKKGAFDGSFDHHARNQRRRETLGRQRRLLAATAEPYRVKVQQRLLHDLSPRRTGETAHSHAKGEETVYIVSGTGKVKIGDEIYDIEPDRYFSFPRRAAYGLDNGTVPLKLMCFYAPCAEAVEYTFHEEFDFRIF
jgi:mannose-6-phosphate isomerase-like protein (cupin superfamily)